MSRIQFAGNRKSGRSWTKNTIRRTAAEALESRLLFNAGGGWSGGGILGEYYTGTSYTGLSFTRTDVRIDFTSGTALPGGSNDPAYAAVVPGSGFSAAWTGSLIPKYTESYTLKIDATSNDSSTLIINGSTLSTGTGNHTDTYSFTAGTTYSVTLDYSHAASSTWQMQMHWSSTGAHPFAEEAIEPGTTVGIGATQMGAMFANGVLGASYVLNGEGGTPPPVDSNGWPEGDFDIGSYNNGGDLGGVYAGPEQEGLHVITFTGSATISNNDYAVNPVQFYVGYSASTGVTSSMVIAGSTYYCYGTSGTGLPVADQVLDTATSITTGYNPTTNQTTVLAWVEAGANPNIGFSGTSRNGTGAPGGPTGSPQDNGVTNLSIMMPQADSTVTSTASSYPAGTIFSAPMLQQYAPYTVLRTDQWTDTFNSPDYGDAAAYNDWSTRALPNGVWESNPATLFTQNNPVDSGYYGASPQYPWEYAIMLANETGKDLYIDLPPSASGTAGDTGSALTSSYLYHLAQLIKNGDSFTFAYTGNVTSGSTTITNLPTTSISDLFVGEAISGAGIPTGTKIASINTSLSTITLSHAATTTATGENLTMTVSYPALLPNLNVYIEYADENWGGLPFSYGNAARGMTVAYQSNTPEWQTFSTKLGGSFSLESAVTDNTFADLGLSSGSEQDPLPESPPWFFAGTSGVSYNGALGAPPAPSGTTETAYIQGTGSISQYVLLPAGTDTISFDAAYSGTADPIVVSVNGTAVSTITPTSSASFGTFTTSSFTLAAAGNINISFAGKTTGDTSFLSEINVNSGGSAVQQVAGGETMLWEGLRVYDAATIFDGVYGGGELPGESADPRIRPVTEWQYGGQGTTGFLTQMNTGYANGYLAHPVSYWDYGGGGGFYADDRDASTTTTALFADAATLESPLVNSNPSAPGNPSGLDITGDILSDDLICNEYGLHDVGYEGGFSWGAGVPTTADTSASTQSQTTQFEVDNLTQFFQAGGSLPILFCDAGYPVNGVGSLPQGWSMIPTSDIWDQAAPAVLAPWEGTGSWASANTPKVQGVQTITSALPPAALPAGWTQNVVGPFTLTGNLTSGSTTITSVSSFIGVTTGQILAGSGIPWVATISAYSTSSNTITLSQAATATTTGATIQDDQQAPLGSNSGNADDNNGTFEILSTNPTGKGPNGSTLSTDVEYDYVSTPVSGNSVTLTAELTSNLTGTYPATGVEMQTSATDPRAPLVTLEADPSFPRYYMVWKTSEGGSLSGQEGSISTGTPNGGTSITGTFTSGSTTMTSVTNFSASDVGQAITGADIPINTTIATYTTAGSVTTVTLSNAATASTSPSTCYVAGVPVWMKLVESNGTFTGYISRDDVSWTSVATVSISGTSFSTSAFTAGLFQDTNGGAGNASTFQNVSVTSDALYVASSAAGEVYKYSGAAYQGATSATTSANNFAALAGVYGVTVDPNGNVLIDNDEEPSSQAVAYSPGGTSLSSSTVASGDTQTVYFGGSMYISDFDNSDVYSVPETNGTFSTPISSFTTPNSPNRGGGALAVVSNSYSGTTTNYLYIANYDANAVYVYNLTTGSLVSSVSASISGAAGLAVDPEGQIYASSFSGNKLYRITPTYSSGTLTGISAATIAITAGTSSGLSDPNALAFGPDGNLYIAEYGSDDIDEINIDGNGNTTLDQLNKYITLSYAPDTLAFGPNA